MHLLHGTDLHSVYKQVIMSFLNGAGTSIPTRIVRTEDVLVTSGGVGVGGLGDLELTVKHRVHHCLYVEFPETWQS